MVNTYLIYKMEDNSEFSENPIIKSRSELVDHLQNKLPLGIGFEGFNPEKHYWTSSHSNVQTGGLLASQINSIVDHNNFDVTAETRSSLDSNSDPIIDIKSANLLGYLLITALRPFGEKLWNDSFAVYQGPRKGFSQEAEIFDKLNAAGIPTPISLQSLISSSNLNKSLPLVSLTVYDPNLRNTVDILKLSNPQKTNQILTDGAELLYRTHEAGVIMADPWWGNIAESDKVLKIINFDFKANPKMLAQNPSLAKMHDLSGLVVSGAHRSYSTDEEVVSAMLSTYPVTASDVRNLGQIVDYDRKHLSGSFVGPTRNAIFQDPVYGLDQSRVLKIKEELYKQAS